MAGNYADAPNNRIAWHEDGTVMYSTDGSNVGMRSQGEMDIANAEGDGAWLQNYGWTYMGLYFPALMDLTGIGARFDYTSTSWQWSPNTSTGVDGTWNSFTGPSDIYGKNAFRQGIGSVSLTGVRSIRVSISNIGSWSFYRAWHIYGKKSAGQTLDRLEIWHPTLDERVGAAYFDWGNVPRSSTADRTFRVKNISPTKTANNVLLSYAALTDTSPSVPGQHLVSANGVTFAGTQTITSIAPGAISSVYTVRRVTPSDATLSLWWARLKAVAGSWT